MSVKVIKETFEKLCTSHGITPYRVCKGTGITTATISNWKAGRYTPKADKLQKIADYFGVPLSYLLTGKMEEDVKEPVLTPRDERDIALNRLKILNKEKYTPKKYKKCNSSGRSAHLLR